jgi:hypothetical protein
MTDNLQLTVDNVQLPCGGIMRAHTVRPYIAKRKQGGIRGLTDNLQLTVDNVQLRGTR